MSCNHESGTNKTFVCGCDSRSRCTSFRQQQQHEQQSARIMGKCKFNEIWLSNKDFSAWLKLVPGNLYEARCILCKKCFKLGTMRRKALESHMHSAKHKASTSSCPQTPGVPQFGGLYYEPRLEGQRGMLSSKPGLAGPRKSISFSVAESPW